MNEIRFFVSGTPAPGGSKNVFGIKKAGVYTGRFVVTDAGGKRNKEWKQDVAKAAFIAMKQADALPLTGAIKLELLFQIRRPKSHFRSDGVTLKLGAPPCHVIRPDCTKLARSTEDACTGILWHDDSQIVKQTHEKFYSDQSGAWIVIKESGR